MEDDAIGIIQRYLGSRRDLLVLGTSNRANSGVVDRKLAEAAAFAILSRPVSPSFDPRPSLLAARALYRVNLPTSSGLHVVKTHQAFVISLIDHKHYRAAIDHLRLIKRAFCQWFGLDATTNVSEDTPYLSRHRQWAKMVVAWHFLVLQIALNYAAQNPTIVAGNADETWTVLVYSNLATWFLSNSQFSQWVAAVPEALPKYAANKVKLAKGMVHIFTRILKLIDSTPLRLVRSAFALICLQLSGGTDTDVAPYILVDDTSLKPFIDDLQSNPILYQQVTKLCEPDQCLCLIIALKDVVTSPTLEEVDLLAQVLQDPPEYWMNKIEVLEQLSRFQWTPRDPVLVRMATVLSLAFTIKDRVPEITKEVISVIDAITIWIKNSGTKHAYNNEMLKILANLAEATTPSVYYRRLRNFSNLSMHIYQVTKLDSALKQAISFDKALAKRSGEPNDVEFLTTRLTQVSAICSPQRLLDVVRFVVEGSASTVHLSLEVLRLIAQASGLDDAEKWHFVSQLSADNQAFLQQHLGVTAPKIDGISGLILYLSQEWNQDNFDELLLQLTQNNPLEDILVKACCWLKYQCLYGYIATLLKDTTSIRQQFELANALLHLHQIDDAANLINQISGGLRAAQISDISTIIQFNCLQLHLMILQGNHAAAQEKYTKVSRILESKLNARQNDIRTRYGYIILVAELDYWGSRIQCLANNYSEAYRGAKVAIKFIHTAIRAPDDAVSTSQRWHVTALLGALLSLVMEILKHLGITRDLLYYRKELAKLTEIQTIPVRQFLWLVELMQYDCLLKDSVAFEQRLSLLDSLMDNALISDDVVCRYLRVNITRVQRGQPTDGLTPPIASTLPFYCTLDIPNLEWLYLLLLSDHSHAANSVCTTTSQLFALKADLLEAVNELKKLPEYSSLAETVLALPGVGADGAAPHLDETTLNNLVACKNGLLRLFQDHKAVATFKLKEVVRIINQCLLALSAILLFKEDSQLLSDMYYIQEVANLVPFENDEQLDHAVTKFSGLGPVAFALPSPNNFESTRLNFTLDLNMHLPMSWLVVTLDICDSTGSLIVSRFTKGSTPFFVRLSMSRPTSTMSFNHVMAEFNQIIAESNLSTKLLTTSKIIDKQQRRKWWELRYLLDYRLKEVLQRANEWFAGFSGLFSNYAEDQVYRHFREDLIRVFERHQMKWTLDHVFRLFYGLDDLHRPFIEDLVSFVVDLFIFHGHPIDHRKLPASLTKSVMKVLEKYLGLKTPVANHHVILVPLARVQLFPWESIPCLQDKSVLRVPCLTMLIKTLKSYSDLRLDDIERCMYLINPAGDLKRTEESFAHAFKRQGWTGIVGRKPEENELVPQIFNLDLFVYLGHGSSDRYIPTSTLYQACLTEGHRPPPLLLIGCSLGVVTDNGLLEPHGAIMNWLTCGAPMVLANLWDVTDKDIDLFSQSVFDKWGLLQPNPRRVNIAEAVMQSRTQCNLQYLNGCAPVVYGVPFSL